MQYTTGTVTTVNGSQNIVGTNTKWVSNVDASYTFKVVADEEFYEILSITDDTHLVLSSPYQGTSASGVSYVILRDYTTNFDFPTITKGDINWPEVVSRAIQLIDANLYETQSGKSVKSITFDPQTSAPSTSEGKIYYNDTENSLIFWNGVAWKKLVAHSM